MFVSRSFNINRVATQAVEDVLNIGEYQNSYYVTIICYIMYIFYYMLAINDAKYLIKIFPPFLFQ